MKKRQENEKKTEKWQTVLGKVLNSEDKAEKQRNRATGTGKEQSKRQQTEIVTRTTELCHAQSASYYQSGELQPLIPSITNLNEKNLYCYLTSLMMRLLDKGNSQHKIKLIFLFLVPIVMLAGKKIHLLHFFQRQATARANN